MGTDPARTQEWLRISRELALKRDDGSPIPIEDFFNFAPFVDGKVHSGDTVISHTGFDQYTVKTGVHEVIVDLREDTTIAPPYRVQSDYVPGGLVKMGLEVLGGASGFTPPNPAPDSRSATTAITSSSIRFHSWTSI